MGERTYRIKRVAELTGVSAGAIRAWERRYGAVRPRRSSGNYRVYTEAEVDLLRSLKRFCDEGVAIGEAVHLLPDLPLKPKTPAAQLQTVVVEGAEVVRWQERVFAAATRMDQRAVGKLLDERLRLLPSLEAFRKRIFPLQREVGRRWHQRTMSIAHEHLVTHEVRVRLLTHIQKAPRMGRRHVVCACVLDEEHEIGLLGAALLFRHSGFRVTYLGSRTPLEQLAKTVQVARPDVVALSFVNDRGRRRFRETLKAAVLAVSNGVAVIAGGRACEFYKDAAEELGVQCLGDSLTMHVER